MYLSRLKLDTSIRKTCELMIQPYTLHQAVYRAFPDRADGGPGRVLYRIDMDRRSESISLIVQSEKSPDWERADYLRECLFDREECKSFTPSVAGGMCLRFRLRANPSVKRQAEGKKNGYRLGLLREEDQLQWLQRKADTSGFTLVNCRVIPEGIVRADKNLTDKDKVRHYGIVFEGVLKVIDPDQFLGTLGNGIGSAKGFGFGLLSVAPVKD